MARNKRLPAGLAFLFALAVALPAVSACDSSPTGAGTSDGVLGDGRLPALLEQVRAEHDLPALAAVFVQDGAIMDQAAVGVRVEGFPEEVTVNDRWSIASLSKSMTATVAGFVVESGMIDWDSTIGEVLPEMVPEIRSEYVDVTLEELLSHRSGLPHSNSTPYFETLRGDPTPPVIQRRPWTKELLQLEPVAVLPGTYSYSNGGYIVAATMLEAASGESWDHLLQTEIFDPLGMDDSGLGFAATAGTRDSPWGHVSRDEGGRGIIDPDQPYRIALGPSGGVVTTLSDYAAYMADHLAGARAEGGLLEASTYERLHTPIGVTEYAVGWGVANRSWAEGRVLNHGGSFVGFISVVWLAPGIDVGMFAVTNVRDDESGPALGEAIGVMIRRFEAADR